MNDISNWNIRINLSDLVNENEAKEFLFRFNADN